MKQIILASASPRRKQLLESAGIAFIVDPSRFKEYTDYFLLPEELVKQLALGKAKDVAKRYRDSLVIGADTIVFFEGEYLGKPKDKKNAKTMLQKLRGKMHKVMTGFAVLDTTTGISITEAVTTKVFMKNFSDEEIDSYLSKETYLDKAGTYAIQEVGDIFVDRVEGDYDTVVGLPVKEVLQAISTLS